MTATEILRAIETVSPDDSAGLDRIDAMVFCLDLQHKFIEYNKEEFVLWTLSPSGLKFDWRKGIPEYTRSRDALKQIRPDGWEFSVGTFLTHDSEGWNCEMCRGVVKVEYDAPTEELAELWCIIIAIEHERASHDHEER